MTSRSKPELRSRGRRLAWLLLIPLLALLTALLIERWRGHRALGIWKREMIAKGELREPQALWPQASAASVSFDTLLSQALTNLPKGFGNYSGQLSGIVQKEGQCRRGSQELSPLVIQKRSTNSWQILGALIQEAQPALKSLRQLMKNPPHGVGYNIMERLEDNSSFPNFVSVRVAAQALHTAAIYDLHDGNLAGALENLTALAGFARLHSEDPNLVNFMIRMAISGLTTDASWDALQANGWTEQQLAILQEACQDNTLLREMPGTMEAERAGHLHRLDWFRSHSYEGWIARNLPILESFGYQGTDLLPSASMRRWHQWVFHPVWSFAWAEQEELDYLKFTQKEAMALRQASEQGSWFQLNQQLVANHQNYRVPGWSWRFYIGLPFDQLPEVGRGPNVAAPACPGVNYSRAWFVIFQNLTLREMVVTAIAIKRYELRQGKPPSSLSALMPDFLGRAPRDFMDGQPLRYRLNQDGSFTLYSVGENARDDGGSALPDTLTGNARSAAPWTGRNWVWPRDEGHAKAPGA